MPVETMAHGASRRDFLRWAGGAAAAFAASACSTPHEEPATAKPNIVFVLSDDLGYGDLGCYNPDSKIPTPNLDRLASQGMRFTDAHSPSAVCTPTRYGTLTGQYCWRTHLKQGVLWGLSPNLIEPGRMTVASMLKQHGYRTAGVGKWHLGLGDAEETDYSKPLRPGPLDHGFDYFFGIPASLDMEPYVFFENDRVLAEPTEHVEGVREQRGIFWREGPIAPDFRHIDVLPKTTDKAVEVIRNHAQEASGDPLFLYFPVAAPHTPWLPTEEFEGKSGAGPYGDFTAMLDDAIGQVMRALDESGMTDGTLFIFTSDNGAHWLPGEIEKWDHRANAHLRGQKADIWEGGHRVPFIVRWPGKVRPGSTSDETVCLTDLLATAAEVVGADLPDDAGEDSYSIVPALLEQERAAPIREGTVHHSAQGRFAIRQGPWKLHLGRGSGGFTPPAVIEPGPGEPAGELFNLADDPAEANNLYDDRPDLVESLTALLDKYKAEGRSRPLAGA